MGTQPAKSVSASIELLYSSRKRERALGYLPGVIRGIYRLASSHYALLSSPVKPESSTDELSETISFKRAKRVAVCTKGSQHLYKKVGYFLFQNGSTH